VNLKLIMNPGSRSGRGQRLWAIWESGLQRAGIAFDCRVTQAPGDACRISRESGNAETVVAVGGDGTINEVLDGLVQSGRSEVRMGVLYSGTSPDFCRFHGIPTDPVKALRCLIDGKARKVDVARIEYADQGGGMQVAHFGCGCNIGMGAAVARFSNQKRRFMGDALGTGLAVCRAIMFSEPVDLDLEVDGETLSLARVNNLSVLKNPYIASGLRLNVALHPDDGRLMLVAVHGQSRAGLCTLLPGFYSGKAVGSAAVFMKECSRISVRSAKAQEIEFDGDPRGYLPAAIRVLPRALNLIGGHHE
jgi:diacylglycerol kinase family enzyme